MAIIINFDGTVYGDRPEQALVDTVGSLADVPENATPQRLAELEEQKWDACQHRQMMINDQQRTVKCGQCKMWLDPVWCLRELFRHYETRVDSRLQAIKDYEEREKKKREAKEKRKVRPRAHRIETRNELLQRAAWNEYQAKVLAIRAEAQRTRISKIEAELAQEPTP